MFPLSLYLIILLLYVILFILFIIYIYINYILNFIPMQNNETRNNLISSGRGADRVAILKFSAACGKNLIEIPITSAVLL